MFVNLSRLRPLTRITIESGTKTVFAGVALERRTYNTKKNVTPEGFNLWNLSSRILDLPKMEATEGDFDLTNPRIKKLLQNHKSTCAILKGLMDFARQIDPCTHGDAFANYCMHLDKLGIYGPDIETLFEVCGNDLVGFMAILRARQLGLIDRDFISSKIKDKQAIDIQPIIKGVQKELFRILDVETLIYICGNDSATFKVALRARIWGVEKEEVYTAVLSGKLKNRSPKKEEEDEQQFSILDQSSIKGSEKE